MDADFEPAESSEEKQKTDEPADEELNRFIGMFKLARESGYTLKLIPGTPEKNVPIFNLKTGEDIKPAA